MADILRLKQIRSGHRTHAKKLMDKAVKEAPKSYDEAKVLLATLAKKQEVLEKCDGDVMQKLESEEEILDEIEGTSNFSDQLIEAKTKLELITKYLENKALEDNVKSEAVDDKKSVGTKQNEGLIKLPRYNIKEYDGSLLTWNTFWDQFDIAVHQRKDLSDIQKFTYLNSYLTGEAERSIKGLSSDKNNYKNAIDMLISRFGNKQLIFQLI